MPLGAGRHLPDAARHRHRAALLARSRATRASRGSPRPPHGSCGRNCLRDEPRLYPAADGDLRLTPGVGAAGPRARSRARVAVPLGLGAARRLAPRCCARAQLDVGFWIDEGLSVGIADRPLDRHPGRAAPGRLAAALLRAAARLDRARRRAARRATHALSLLFAAAHDPGRLLGAGARCSAAAPAWIAAVLAALNPFLTQYAQETRMYSLVALLGLIATDAASLQRLHRRRAPPARRWPVLASRVALAAMLYTHNWALFFGAATGRRVARAAVPGARPPSAARGCCDGAARLRQRRAAVPAVAADAAVPGRAHRRAVVAARRDYERSRSDATPGCSATSREVALLLAAGRAASPRCSGAGRGRR